jgi:hypothetical protein
MADKVQVLVGTRKGAFIYTSDAKRERWEVSEPQLTGWGVLHLSADNRDGGRRYYAAANHWAWGPSVAKSSDGKEWDWRSTGLGFPQDMDTSIGNVWQVEPGHPSEPGVLYAGTQPAGLFRSEDWGQNWAPVDALNRHPQRQRWSGTGGGDSCLHSLSIDPRDAKRMYAAVSAGGSYATSDGGKTWEIFSHTAIPQTDSALEFTRQINEQFADQIPEDVDPLAVNEMHKMRLDAKNPDRVWTQTHVGVFRSDDKGATWSDVTEGLPSFHGFPIAVTKRAPDAAYVVPLAFEGAMNNFRVCPGQFTVCVPDARRGQIVAADDGGAAGPARLPERVPGGAGHRRDGAGGRLRGDEQRAGLREHGRGRAVAAAAGDAAAGALGDGGGVVGGFWSRVVNLCGR